MDLQSRNREDKVNGMTRHHTSDLEHQVLHLWVLQCEKSNRSGLRIEWMVWMVSFQVERC